jgi:hypothetical protein
MEDAIHANVLVSKVGTQLDIDQDQLAPRPERLPKNIRLQQTRDPAEITKSN